MGDGQRTGEVTSESPRDLANSLIRRAEHIHARLREPGHILGQAGLAIDIAWARDLLTAIEKAAFDSRPADSGSPRHHRGNE